MPAGYSNRSLVEKLGFKPGTTALIVAAPDGYSETLGPLPEGVNAFWCADLAGGPAGELDFVQLFSKSQSELEMLIPRVKEVLADAGTFWVSWPKKSSKVPTDVTEDTVRAIALGCGLVDVKVCAVDEVWSGLKLVRRLADRKPNAKEASSRRRST